LIFGLLANPSERTQLPSLILLRRARRYATYEPRVWWFEVFETMRRLTLTGGQVFLAPGTEAQIILNIIICIGSMRVYAEYTPFKSSANNSLAETAQWQLFATMLAALMIRVDAVGEDGYSKAAFDFFLAFFQFLAPALLIFQLVTQAKTLAQGELVELDDNSGDLSVFGALDTVTEKANSLDTDEEVHTGARGEFALNQKITRVRVGEGVKKVGASAFNFCSRLEEFDMGSAEVVGERAFFKCTSLKEVKLSMRLRSVERSAFQFCKSLTRVAVPDSLRSIGP
jgi:hypothetical protein